MLDRASLTAETVALQRAFESNRPARDRLFVDPFASRFLSGFLRAVAAWSALPLVGPLAPMLYDMVGGPGPRPSAVARTRLIDELVDGSAHRQIVLLGAGYDARAHRFTSLADRRVFEVDHPATQQRKRQMIQQVAPAHDHVVYVPVDFERDSLRDALLNAGFDPYAPAFFLWEGVTNYLTESAVDATFEVIRSIAAEGTTVVFTYVHAGVIDGSVHFPDAERWVRAVRRAGEPWTFGLTPSEVPRFLDARGFRLVSDVSTFEAGERWFPARGRRDRGSSLYRVAVATKS